MAVLADTKSAAVMLADADERRQFAAAVSAAPDAQVYVYAGAPPSLDYYGGEYVIRVYHKVDAVYRLDDQALPRGKPMTLLIWDSKLRKLRVSEFDTSLMP